MTMTLMQSTGINRSQSPRSLPARAIATWFGCGYVPIAPGTAGSLAAIAIAFALHVYAGSGRVTFLVLSAILLIPGIWAAGVVAREEGKKDPRLIVVDEVIGQWITVAGASTLNWKSWLLGVPFFFLL